MEPVIKSEPCEELYSEKEGDYPEEYIRVQESETALQQAQPQKKLKRLYEEIEDSSSSLHRHPNTNSYPQSFEFPGAPQQLQDSFNIQEPNQNAAPDEKQLKKYKRLEASVLFNPPFFNLVEELLTSNKDAMAARCYSCGKVVKGNRGITSNFIKHMKRSHPETYKLYDGYKSHKTKSYYLPNLPQILTRKSASIVENGASGSDSTAANSNDDTNQFFETNTTLENTALNDSSDDNEDAPKGSKDNATTNEHIKLPAKTLEALGSIVDEKMKTYVEKEEYERLNEKVNALTNPSKACDVAPNCALSEMRIELDNLKKECSELRSAIQKSQASRRQLQNELQAVDKLLHQRKIIIKNISVCDPENPVKSVEKLFKDILHLENIKIVHCCIIPSVKTSVVSNRENVSVELGKQQDCRAIFRQTQKLKNTGVFIESEISPFQRKRKNKLIVLRKELLRRKPELKVLVRDTGLIVNGKFFYWDDVEGLCHDCNHKSSNLNGVEYLKDVSGLDLSEFIVFLHHYNVQTN